jgi:hypothetical protein
VLFFTSEILDFKIHDFDILFLGPTGRSNSNLQSLYQFVNIYVNLVLCHHGLARSRVEDGGKGLQIWRIVGHVLIQQSRAVNKEWSSSLGVRRGSNNLLSLLN